MSARGPLPGRRQPGRLPDPLCRRGPHLAGFPGLVWKLWLLDESTREAAGIYLFADAAAAQAFVASPVLDALRQSPGISGVRASVLPVVPDLSRATFGERAGV